MNFETIAQAIENILSLPLGTVRALTNLDLSDLIKERLEIADKDKARLLGFGSAVFQRVVDMAFTIGVEVGIAKQAGEGIPSASVAVSLSQEFQQFVKETLAVVAVFYKQTQELDVTDPFQEEREILRIYAKRNKLDVGFQKLLGVSDKTPSEYPEGFQV